MNTQLDFARAGIVTEEMRQAVAGEPVSAEELRDLIAAGWAVLPKNRNHSFPILRAIGQGLKTKVNANLGTSGECCSMEMEAEKLKAALDAKTDSIMDLSTGGDLAEFRRFFLEHSPVTVGAVPIYTLATEMMARHQSSGRNGRGPAPEEYRKTVQRGDRLYYRPLRGHSGGGKAARIL